jgi:hypothetical protein
MARCAFERTSKRRRGFPSETHVKRGERVVHGDKELLPPRSSVAWIPARAARADAIGRAAATAAAFNGDRDHYIR